MVPDDLRLQCPVHTGSQCGHGWTVARMHHQLVWSCGAFDCYECPDVRFKEPPTNAEDKAVAEYHQWVMGLMPETLLGYGPLVPVESRAFEPTACPGVSREEAIDTFLAVRPELTGFRTAFEKEYELNAFPFSARRWAKAKAAASVG